MSVAKSPKQKEVEQNFKAFQKLLETIPRQRDGQFALMRDGKLVEYYLSWEDAFKTGEKFFDDGLYSIQMVSTKPVDLGFFSHAVVHR